ncbi:MAG: hypothetical protein WCI76_01635, partial [bacterium]
FGEKRETESVLIETVGRVISYIVILTHIVKIKNWEYNETMQKISTRIFIYSSIVFGIIGILVVITGSGPDAPDSNINQILIRLLFATVFIILPSFALSVASKYLNDKS